MSYEVVKKGVVKRVERREVGLFVDGIGLDRAARRLNKKIDYANLVRGVTAGSNPIVARYYTLIPFEDDSRHRSFLDAVARAGLTVIVKRLPPKGIDRQVSIDIEMAADITAFALGHSNFSNALRYDPDTGSVNEEASGGDPTPDTEREPDSKGLRPVQRIVTVVCPSRDLAYPIGLAKEFGVDTVTADFGKFNSGNVLKSAAKWIDLSDSETIWR